MNLIGSFMRPPMTKERVVDLIYSAFSDGSFKKESDLPGEKPPGAGVGWGVYMYDQLLAVYAAPTKKVTSNQTEIAAAKPLVSGLIALGIFEAKIFVDIENLVRALRGMCALPRGSTEDILDMILEMEKHNCRFTFVHVKSKENPLAHFMAGIGHKNEFDPDMVRNPPEGLKEAMEEMKEIYLFQKRPNKK